MDRCCESLPGRIDAQCVKMGVPERFGEDEAMDRVEGDCPSQLGGGCMMTTMC